MEQIKVGISGTGFIARLLVDLLSVDDRFKLVKILTRRELGAFKNTTDKEIYTNSTNELIDLIDVLVECSGDVSHAAYVINQAQISQKPVVTMNTEFHVTVGSYFVGRGYLSEAEGDQPGSTAALHEDVINMGFKPRVFGNMKGFLNHAPTPTDMKYWSKKNGVSISQTTSFTDGTKIQLEQAFTANGLNGMVAQQGLFGVQEESIEASALKLGELSRSFDKPIADYIMASGTYAGVFIVAEHQSVPKEALVYFKMGEGPFYTIVRPFHLCSLEIPKTILRAIETKRELLNNSSNPSAGVIAICKTTLRKDDTITKAIGGFDVRGEATNWESHKDYVPIGLLSNARLKRNLEPGDIISWDDVELVDNYGLQIARELYGHESIL